MMSLLQKLIFQDRLLQHKGSGCTTQRKRRAVLAVRAKAKAVWHWFCTALQLDTMEEKDPKLSSGSLEIQEKIARNIS